MLPNGGIIIHISYHLVARKDPKERKIQQMTQLLKNMTMKEFQKTGKKPYTFLNFLLGIVFIGALFFVVTDSLMDDELKVAMVLIPVTLVGNIIILAITSKSVGFTIKWTLLGALISIWVFIRIILIPIIMISAKFIGVSTGSGYDTNGKVNHGTSVFSIMSYKNYEVQSDVVTGGGDPQYVGGYNELQGQEGAKILGYDSIQQAQEANPNITNEVLQNVYEQRNDEQKTLENVSKFGK